MTWVGSMAEVIVKDGASPAYLVENLERMRPVYKKIIGYAQAMGFNMIQGDYEDDGQIELNWDYDRGEPHRRSASQPTAKSADKLRVNSTCKQASCQNRITEKWAMGATTTSAFGGEMKT